MFPRKKWNAWASETHNGSYTGSARNLRFTMQSGQESMVLTTVEPRYNEVLGTIKNDLVISGFSLYQGTKTKKYKELGPANLPCYKRVLLYPTSL